MGLSTTIIYFLMLVYAVACAYFLRSGAIKARRKALDRLRALLTKAEGNGDEKQAAQISQTIDEIVAFREGAFAPITEHPILGAFVVPLGGVTLLAVFEYLAGSGWN